MSYGNTKTDGNKGNNTPWQKAVLFLLKLISEGVSAATGPSYANNANYVAGDSGAITNTTAAILVAAPATGQRIYITSVLVTNSHASVGTLVTLTDSGGTPIKGATGYASPTGGGYSITFPTAIKGPVSGAIYATCGTTGANVYVSVVGYKGV